MPVIIDVETTGLDAATDRVIQVGIVKTNQKFTPIQELAYYINPQTPIPPEATAIHGITDAMVALAPRFRDVAETIQAVIRGQTIGGYNTKFDIEFLHAELIRAGQEGIPMNIPVIDAHEVFKQDFPRTLTNAATFYGVPFKGAHDAVNDARATVQILKQQAGKRTYEEMLILPDRNYLDRARLFYLREDGIVCFNFGKHRNEPAILNVSYLQWMLGQQFAPSTLEVVRQILGVKS